MPSPEVFNIGSQLNGARRFARTTSINIHRELEFHGETLELFEITPTGETLLLSLDEDWNAKRKEDNANFPEHPFEFVVIESDDATETILKKTAIVKVQGKTFKVLPVQSSVGNLGVFKFRAKMV